MIISNPMIWLNLPHENHYYNYEITMLTYEFFHTKP